MAFTIHTLTESIIEAQRFIERAKAARDDMKAGGVADKETAFVSSSKSAAARRASMDLTRTLAELRRR